MSHLKNGKQSENDLPEMVEPDHVETPQELRTRIRAGDGKFKPTSGLCPGYQQANLAFIPDEHFDDFSQFCELNSGPLPVLHKSTELEDYNAEPLTDNYSDARTDAPG